MSKLYLVGTPIGCLGDLSPRAAQALEMADFIAAEDTRVSVKLLNHLGLKKPMISYFQHNAHQRGGEIVARMLAGESCAIVTDAGMPCISDPGEELVALCHENGIPIEVVPGPTAAMSALAASGLPTGRFCFEGFLSVKKPSRREHLLSLCAEPRTMVFYEAPHKLRATLADMLEAWGDRRLTLARELTKVHEEIVLTTLADAAEKYAHIEPRGEFVLVIEGAKPAEPQPRSVMTFAQAVERARSLAGDGLSMAEAAKRAALESGYKRGELYRAAAADD